MLDIKWLRSNVCDVERALGRRHFVFPRAEYEKLEQQRREWQQETEQLQQRRNSSAREVARAKKENVNIQPLLDSVKSLGDDLDRARAGFEDTTRRLQRLLSGIPNPPHESVPEGRDEDDNVEVSRCEEPVAFDFPVADHVTLAERKSWLMPEQSSAMSGARFVVMRGDMARLHRALAQFMLDWQTERNGYEEINPPVIVNDQSLYGTGQLPKFAEDIFAVDHGGDQHSFYLVPTAEVPLTNLFARQIFTVDQLPRKVTAHTLCFRSEAGSSGKDSRGLIRQHQFEKVELVQAVLPAFSMQALEEMRDHAEQILNALELPHRTMCLCAGDMGFSACKTYDLEVWLPAQGCYREISSISNCGDFQARRMQGRWRNPGTGKTEYLHTLNGSGVAVGRALAAVLENGQDREGNIHLPGALHGYMGKSVI